MASGKKSDYTEQLCSVYGKTEEQIRAQAGRILYAILHDYSSFHISTIDHFFQQVIRAFMREIGLQGNYRIEMDNDAVLSEAIDNMLAELDNHEDKQLLSWLLRFSEDKIEDGKSWNIRREIRDLGKQLFMERYLLAKDEVANDTADKQILAAYRDTLVKICQAKETEAKNIAAKALKIIAERGLELTDFKNKNILNIFKRLSKADFTEPSASFRNLTNPEDYYTKTAPTHIKDAITDACESGLRDCVKQTLDFFDDFTEYYTAQAILKNFSSLGILIDLSVRINNWLKEHNSMMIADTNDLLGRIIGSSDTPFVYEKTGSRIDNYMIDEFQDTSEMQWRNFRPLIEDSLAYQRDNLIVGDVKQSIYRFRNSDWRLLDEQVAKDFRDNEAKTLNVNWRSCRLIVEFNNTFFALAPKMLQTVFNADLTQSSLSEERQSEYSAKIVNAYSDSYQCVAPPFRNKDGHITVDFLPDSKEKPWEDEAMERLPKVIEQLQDKGYTPRDIAILVRDNKEGIVVADTLLSYKELHGDTQYSFDILTEDALIIGNSAAVRFMVGMTDYVYNIDNVEKQQLAGLLYAALKKKSGADATHNTGFSDETIEAMRALTHRSFYEAVEGIYRMFSADIPDNELVYVQAFLDVVAEHSDSDSDAGKFVEWWEETGSAKQKVEIPDSQNAIRIMTIHKSKGLGFKAVIIPFADWQTEPKVPPIIWCRPQTAPFNRLKIVPVKCVKELVKSAFAEDYYNEKLYSYIDNLNALYVAFTRAKEELVVFTPDEKGAQQIAKIIKACISTSATDDVKLMPLADGYNEACHRFEWGESRQTTPDTEHNLQEIRLESLPSAVPAERLNLRSDPDDRYGDASRRRYGLMMHDALSRINTAADISRSVASLVAEGRISSNEAPEVRTQLERMLANPAAAGWFDGASRVMNETEILYGNGSYRPDRIVVRNDSVEIVDYKFGEQKDDRYNRQVGKYVSLVKRIGYQDVKGYVWYVGDDEIVEVCA